MTVVLTLTKRQAGLLQHAAALVGSGGEAEFEQEKMYELLDLALKIHEAAQEPKGDPVTCWTVTLEIGGEEEAIDVWVANSHESERFFGALVERAGAEAYGTSGPMPTSLGPRGERQ